MSLSPTLIKLNGEPEASGNVERAPSPAAAELAMRTLSVSSSPRTRKRSTSMKKPKVRQCEDFELDEIRPRTSSLPTRNTYRKPNLLEIRANAGILYEDSEQDLYRLRSFITTSKGLVNRGDSMISKSTNSIVSSGSEKCILSRTSSSLSQNSLGNSNESEIVTKPYRILMLGATGVGKTALAQQFTTSEYLGGFDTSLDGEEEKTVSVLLDGEESAMAFIDPVPLSEEAICCHCIDAYVVVYSIDDRNTFDRAVDLLYKLRKEENNEGAIILVANKCELARARNVIIEEGKAVAKTYDCKFIETSTVLNHNVDELLVGILSQIRLKQKQDKHRGKLDHIQDCVVKGKQLLSKIFKKDNLAKSCENLYVL